MTKRTEEASASIETQRTLSGKKQPVEVENTNLGIHVFLTEPAVVSLEYGVTINMGNYESCRLVVGIRMPCYKENVEPAYAAASAWVEGKIKEQIVDIKKNSKLFLWHPSG